MRITTKDIARMDGIDKPELAETRALERVASVFAGKVRARLTEKQREGKKGWDDPEADSEELPEQLRTNVVRGDWINVGALAALLWNREG